MKKQILSEEFKRMQKLAGLITESQMNEASADEVPLTSKVKKFIDKTIADAKTDGEFENLKEADWFDNELIDELIDLFPNEDYDSASQEVKDYISQAIKNMNENLNSFSPDDNINFQWNPQPQNPKEMLIDKENDGVLLKSDFWKTDIKNRDPEETIPNYGTKQPDGTWVFVFDTGEISGFVEGEDFTL
jgi:hypothetical protein